MSRKSKEILHDKPGYEFQKAISPDSQTRTFHRKQKISSETNDMIKQLFANNQELMERLKMHDLG